MNRSNAKRVIQWDEEIIAEHNKERGTRQIILEPPTPYRYMSESDASASESEISGNHLSESESSEPGSAHFSSEFIPSQISKEIRRNRLSKSNKKRNISFTTDSPICTVSDDWSELQAKLSYEQGLQDDEKAIVINKVDEDFGKDKKFNDRRAAHYNEFKIIQAMKKQTQNHLDDEDHDGEDICTDIDKEK